MKYSLLRAALVVPPLALFAPAAAAQHLGPSVPVRVAAAVNKMSNPSTYGVDDRMMLVETTSTGIRQKMFNATGTRTWQGWTYRSNAAVGGPADHGTNVAVVGGEALSSGVWLPRFNAFFDFRSTAATGSQLRVGMPFWTWLPSNYGWDSRATPTTGQYADFQPYSGYTFRRNNLERVHQFGLDYSINSGMIGLRELWFDGSSWAFIDHPMPPGAGASTPTMLRLGPNSAVRTTSESDGDEFVFVTADNGGLYARHRNQTSCPSWCWEALTAPPYTNEMRTPVAVRYHRDGGTRVIAFVAARVSRYGDWGLYSREWSPNGGWEAWVDRGYPPFWKAEEGWDLVAGSSWYLGTAQYVNLFGQTDPRLCNGTGDNIGGEVITYYYNGSTWQWGHSTFVDDGQETQPDSTCHMDVPKRFQVMSSAVIDGSGWDHLSMFGQTESGATWEYAWENGAWSWRSH